MIKKNNSMILVAKLFNSILLAQIIANITPSLANISNGLLIGNALSPTAMAALSFVAPTGGLLAAMAAVISLGANIMCGNYMGKGESDKINQIFTTAISLIVVLGIGLTIWAEFFTGSVANLLGAEGDALPDTILYLKGLCIGILPTLIVPCLVVFLNMANEITYAMFSAVVLAIVNLLVGLINLHLFQGGMFGMGLASAISEYAALIYLILRFVKKKNLARIEKDGFVGAFVGRMIILGSPSALMFFLYSIRNIQINTMTFETGGTAAVTALGILSSSAGIFDAVNTGIGSAIVMLASVMAGEEDRESLKNLARYTLTFGGVLVIVKTALFAALANPIAQLFGAQGAEIPIAVACIYAYALCMPFNLVPTVFFKTYQCLNRVSLTNFFYLLTCIVFPIGLMKLLGPIYGVYGVWSNYSLTEILTIGVMFVVCFIKVKHVPISIADWLWMDKVFEHSKENQFSISLCEREEIGTTLDCIENKMQSWGVDLKRQTEYQTCISELLEHRMNFSVDSKKKKYAVDILITYSEGKISLRLRDNYPGKGNYVQSEGIKTLFTEIKYQLTFGMNVLILR